MLLIFCFLDFFVVLCVLVCVGVYVDFFGSVFFFGMKGGKGDELMFYGWVRCLVVCWML